MYRSHRGIHFPAFRAEYFTLIHSDLENYDSALEKALLFLSMDYGYGLKLRSEQKGWSFVRRLTDLTMIATDEESFSFKTAVLCGQQSQWQDNAPQSKDSLSSRKTTDVSAPKEWSRLRKILHSCCGFSSNYNTDLYWEGSRSQLSVRIQHPADYSAKYCRG